MKAEKIYKFIESHVNKENIRDLIDILVDECIDTRDFYRAGAKYGLESERIIFKGYDKMLKDLKSKLDSSEDSKTKILEEIRRLFEEGDLAINSSESENAEYLRFRLDDILVGLTGLENMIKKM